MIVKTVEFKQMASNGWEVDFLHRIAEHVASGDTFDETLASAIEFAVCLVRCDECVAYVRLGEQLVPWVWKYSGDRSVEQSRLPIAHDYLRVLSEHLQPIAVSQGVGTALEVRDFGASSIHRGETSVWIPLVARSKLLGCLHLEHRHPRPYHCGEINLLSSMGRILGADIRISQLEDENSDLLLKLETRQLIERGNRILQRARGLSEEEFYLALERQSRQKRRPMKEVAQASDGARRNSVQTE
jgi:GAF domain-containing protein